jgi:hypothetical protein
MSAQWIGILIAAALLAGGSFKVGRLSIDDAVQKEHAQMAAATTAALLARASEHAAKLAVQQKVVNAYDAAKDLPDPATAGLAQRMFIVETAAACGDQVREAGSLAGGAQAPGGVPRGDPEGLRLLQAALSAGSRDALRLNAAVQLAP